jgi:hypothetical protein
MNESQFLRNQLLTELRHLQAVLKACTDAMATAPADSGADPFLQTCADYLIPSVKAFAARDRARLALHYERSSPSDQDGHSASAQLEGAIASATALWSASASATGDVKAFRRATQALAHWLAKREAAAEVLDDRTYTVEQWRKVTFINAKSIVEERERYRRVEAAVPLGVRGMDKNGH